MPYASELEARLVAEGCRPANDRHTYSPRIDDAQAIPMLERLQGKRLRRGPSKLSMGLVGVWMLSLLTLGGAVVIMLAGVLWGLAALSLIASGR